MGFIPAGEAMYKIASRRCQYKFRDIVNAEKSRRERIGVALKIPAGWRSIRPYSEYRAVSGSRRRHRGP